jgi:hypothetical protein
MPPARSRASISCSFVLLNAMGGDDFRRSANAADLLGLELFLCLLLKVDARALRATPEAWV